MVFDLSLGKGETRCRGVFGVCRSQLARASELGEQRQYYKYARFNYPLRVVGLLLSAAFIASLDVESHTLVEWMLFGFYGLVWPHLAYLHTRLTGDSRRGERMNLRLDCILGGVVLYCVDFNPLAVLLFLSLFSLDRGQAYGWRWAVECLSLGALAAIISGLVFGFEFETRHEIDAFSVSFLCCLAALWGYCLMMGNNANAAIRRLRDAKKQINSLNQQIKEQVLVRYLPAEMVEDIFDGKIEMDHEPHAQTITVLFSDLSGFTKLGEELSPKDYASQLNEYLSFMNEIIFGNLGTVDKFMGDAIMVMFGAPKEIPPFQQAQRAATCARAMQHGLDDLNVKWAERGLPALSQRIGIHQGIAVVGNFGSEKRSDYTCIGSAVNLASRIETACEVGKVYVSQSMRDLLPDETEQAGEFELKGIAGKTPLYRLVD